MAVRSTRLVQAATGRACNGHFWFRFALRRTARLASRGDVGPRGVRLSPVAAACYMQLKSRGQTLRRGKSRQQDTLSATALPSERPVVLPTVWETAEAGHWDCVGTHSSWQKARRSTSSGKMLWRDCERVLSYQQNAAWSIFTRALRSLPASGRGNTANEEG